MALPKQTKPADKVTSTPPVAEDGPAAALITLVETPAEQPDVSSGPAVSAQPTASKGSTSAPWAYNEMELSYAERVYAAFMRANPHLRTVLQPAAVRNAFNHARTFLSNPASTKASTAMLEASMAVYIEAIASNPNLANNVQPEVVAQAYAHGRALLSYAKTGTFNSHLPA